MSAMGEFILRRMSMPAGGAATELDDSQGEKDALATLTREFDDFERAVAGRKVIDFGCGEGRQSIALAARYGCKVTGIEANAARRRIAEIAARGAGLTEKQAAFVEKATPAMNGRFDAVISQNSFEHFADPGAILDQFKRLLNNRGKLFITFGPPWLAPYGSHMYFFCRVPWVNVLFSERTVLNVRKDYRHDGASRYEDVEQGLNKMTVARFERLAAASGMRTEFLRYTCIRRMNFLAGIPMLREYFINQVSAVLSNENC